MDRDADVAVLFQQLKRPTSMADLSVVGLGHLFYVIFYCSVQDVVATACPTPGARSYNCRPAVWMDPGQMDGDEGVIAGLGKLRPGST